MPRPRTYASVEMIKDFKAGMRLRALADKYGLDYGTVRSRLIRSGVEMRRTGSWLEKELPPEMVSRYLAGESACTLAAEYGVDPTTVRKKLRLAGVATRGRWPKRAA